MLCFPNNFTIFFACKGALSRQSKISEEKEPILSVLPIPVTRQQESSSSFGNFQQLTLQILKPNNEDTHQESS